MLKLTPAPILVLFFVWSFLAGSPVLIGASEVSQRDPVRGQEIYEETLPRMSW